LYTNKFKFTAKTSKEYESNVCRTMTGSCIPDWDVSLDEIKNTAINHLPTAVADAIADLAREQGFSYTNISITNVHAEYSFRTSRRQFRDWTEIKQFAKLELGCTVQYDSDQPIHNPLIATIIKYVIGAIVGIIIAYFAIEAVKQWLISMTTTTSEWSSWEWVENPETGEWEWKQTSEGKTVTPDIPGIAGVGAIGIVLVVVVLLFLGLGRK